MSRPRVFIPHIPQRLNRALNIRMPAIDVSELTVFGELRQCVNQDVRSRDLDYGAAIEELRTTLADYETGDYLACAGDPVLIGLVLAQMHRKGSVKVLRYDKRENRYLETEVPAA